MPQSPQQQSPSGSANLGIWICTALVVGNMIGSGIFLLPSSLAPYGGVSILGWLATTVGALMTALVFVNLSRRFPSQGGPYRYAYDNFGPFAGFVVAWSYWISIWCGNAAIAVAAVSYSGFFWPAIGENANYAIVFSLIIIWGLTIINIRGVREAGIVQLVTTLLKLLPLALIGISAAFVFEPTAFEPFNPSGMPMENAVVATAALTLWAFLGIESATIPADNVDNPKKTIPRATMLGFAIAAIVYISSQLAIMSLVPREQLVNSSAQFADAAQMLLGDWAGYLIAAGAVISCIGALNGWILLQGQVPMTAARDGLFPKVFEDRNQDGVSKNALLVSSLLISLLVVANFSDGMVALFTFAILVSTLGIFLPYVISIAAEIKAVKNQWQQKKDFLQLAIALAAGGYYIWAISGIGSKELIWGGVLVLAGLPVYWWMRRKNG